MESGNRRDIQPNPLFNTHIQPSSPPPSANKEQLDLWDRVITRRTVQLDRLSLESLQSLYDLLFEKDKLTSKELTSLLSKLPSKKPTKKKHYVSILRYLLICHFHESIDKRLVQNKRHNSLNCVKEILSCLDVAHAAFVSKELKKKECLKKQEDYLKKKSKLDEERKQKQRFRISEEELKRKRQEAESGSIQSPYNSNNILHLPMGSRLSKSAATTPVDSVIEILEDSPPSSPNKKGNKNSNRETQAQTRKETDSHKAGKQDKVPQSPVLQGVENGAKRASSRKEMPKRAAAPLNERTIRTKKLSFAPDIPIGTSQSFFSASLKGRSACEVSINVGFDIPPNTTTTLDGPSIDDLHMRLKRWEPYWKVLHDFSINKIICNDRKEYEVGCKTARVNKYQVNRGDPPLSAFELNFSIPDSVVRSMQPVGWGEFRSCGRIQYANGECRLLMRTIPLRIPEKYKKKKSDTHLWPKGTFIQLNSNQIQLIQRKQQSHDPTLWKGMCHTLDLTQYVKTPMQLNGLRLCTRDDDTYAIQLALCEYISPDALYALCINSDESNTQKIPKLTYEEGLLVAMKYLKKDAVVLDSDDESDSAESLADITLTFSLICSMSMMAIRTPVRGKNCKHMQCFDLQNYIRTNATVSGGRWRCSVCEDFVSLKDLVIDGMMVKMLEKHRDDITGSRDKVQVSKDGSWKLMEENRLRYQKKRHFNDNASNEDGKKRGKVENGVCNRRASAQEEIIELV